MFRDPDLDGLYNLIEYALGLDPAKNSNGSLPVISSAGGVLSLTYQRYAGSGVTYIAEVSGDLGSWSSNSVTETMISSAGTLQTWTATDTTPISGNQRRYMRLRVTSP